MGLGMVPFLDTVTSNDIILVCALQRGSGERNKRAGDGYGTCRHIAQVKIVCCIARAPMTNDHKLGALKCPFSPCPTCARDSQWMPRIKASAARPYTHTTSLHPCIHLMPLMS